MVKLLLGFVNNDTDSAQKLVSKIFGCGWFGWKFIVKLAIFFFKFYVCIFGKSR